ncbi:DUF2752 domain-containing protein [Limnohabitans planktonicus]|uniref:DUF2752 domain-containing protein n=1 Tax=Limnohabitans planktonicus II-D5 TaxID=1293045 RepID=A0A2T7UB83_9BURK|nr:DUF2752 domain-containing protein [Limnohabitans planktonicus]PVE41881.1 hypothetical protein H663_014885 [Limnohabitans planktonicus II-D5]
MVLSTQERWFRCALWILLPVSAQALTAWGLQHDGLVPCLFKQFTDLPCLLCGGTHAVHHLLGLDFGSAFQANAAVSLIVTATGLAGVVMLIEALLGFRFLRKASLSKVRLWGIRASALILMVNWLIILMN